MKLQFLQTFIAKLTMLRLTCEFQKQNIMDFSDPCFFKCLEVLKNQAKLYKPFQNLNCELIQNVLPLE